MIKILVQWFLKIAARRVLRKFKPTVIAVCGSTGKSTTVRAIADAFSSQTDVVASPKNFNAEWGIPLSILRILPEGENKINRWSRVLVAAYRQMTQLKTYPKVLVLEFGMHTIDDVRIVLDIAVPDICVLTNLAPSVLANNSSEEKYHETFSYFIRRIPKDTTILSNADDQHIEKVSREFPGKIIRYGQSGGVDWKISSLEDKGTGQRITLEYQGKIFTASVTGFGIHHAYAAAVVFALADILQLDSSRLYQST